MSLILFVSIYNSPLPLLPPAAHVDARVDDPAVDAGAVGLRGEEILGLGAAAVKEQKGTGVGI